MRKSTIEAEIVAVDKATKNINRINKAAERMTATIVKESKVAGTAFSGFGNRVGMAVKKANVSLNNLNAKVNRVGRNIKKALGTFGLAVGFAAITMAATNTISVFADFEQANAGLTAVMGTTLKQNEALIIDSKRLGATTAKTATEVVGLQEAYARLGFVGSDIINMTEATISGSVAMKAELSDTAELVGAMVKSFDDFESVNAPDIIDKMTLATQKSALNFEKLQTGLPIVAGAANAAGVSFTKLLASQGKLSDAGIDASSSSTALRNIFLEAAKQGVPYESLLQKVANSTDKLATANELFGKRGAVAAVILAKNIAGVNELDIALQSAGGTSAAAAAKQLDTLTGSLTILGSAWEGYVLSVEDGTGAMGGFLKTSVRVITDILAMASGTAKAKDQLTEAELRIRNFAESATTLLNVVKWAIAALVTFKTVVTLLSIATRAIAAAQFLWNTYQAVSLALQGKTLLFLQGNTAATWLYNAATKAQAVGTWLMTSAMAVYNLGLTGAIAATWAFTAALLANPITWIVVGVMALVAAVVLLIKYWDKVTASFKSFFGKKTEINATTEDKTLSKTKEEISISGKINKQSAEGIIGNNFFKGLNKDRSLGNSTDDKLEKANNTKLVEALNKNTDVIKSTEKIGGSPWSGKFKSSILKNANVGDGIMDNSTTQKSVVNNQNTYSPKSKASGNNSELTINVVDKTGDNYGVEVESTGIQVKTTGNV